LGKKLAIVARYWAKKHEVPYLDNRL
jgi:hypothetical protein